MATQHFLALIPHKVENNVIHQRAVDGYVNATAMCKATGKLFADYARLNSSKAFLTELSSVMGIPITGLVVSVLGGTPDQQGTWVHPHVAINLGQWCSPKFAVAVSQWVTEWTSGKFSKTELPYHIKRYLANMSEVPRTHFSMLNELTFNLVGPLEMQGYVLPENMVPDISEGGCSQIGSGRKRDWTRRRSQHTATDTQTVAWCLPRLYPNELLGDFREHFHKVWIPERMVDYFNKRDMAAMEFIPRAFPPLFGSPAKASQPKRLN